ncbi:MAG TPA: hypothetical protein VJT73_05550 [Polyangiaceae bacterium]|nr:hypothetical protein [Polyangiaceae bacterium]
MVDRYRRNHHVGHSNWTAATLQVGGDSTGQASRGFVEGQELRLRQ